VFAFLTPHHLLHCLLLQLLLLQQQTSHLLLLLPPAVAASPALQRRTTCQCHCPAPAAASLQTLAASRSCCRCGQQQGKDQASCEPQHQTDLRLPQLLLQQLAGCYLLLLLLPANLSGLQGHCPAESCDPT
jgi:hypothetical protein